MITIAVQKKLKSASGEMLLDLDLKIKQGSFITLYGKSGVGKTSVLRMIAGLMDPDKGKITLDKNTWFNTDENISLSPQKRKVGFVFQDYALFPNMTVKENLRFALEKGQDEKIVQELIGLIELGDLQDRKPETLSGGQKQRVALARALVQRPDILLMDEPLAALDREMRAKLQSYILQLHKTFGFTVIWVSHDVSEILKMSDYMYVIENGTLSTQGIPSEVFMKKSMSGKFQFTGEVVAIEKQDFIFILSILIGKDLVKVVADEDEISTLNIGDKVIVASKAFNPVVRKID